MHIELLLILLCVLLIASFAIVKFSSKSHMGHSLFASASGVGVLPLTLTFLATQLGGGVVMGTLESAQKHGLGAIGYALGLSLGMILLSLFVGPRYQSLGIRTVPEVFLSIFQSKKLHRYASLLMVASFFLILVAIGVSTRKFLSSLGLENPLYFYGIWIAFSLYTSYGGLHAIMKTESLQVGFILISLIAISVFLFQTYSPQELILDHLKISDDVPFLNWTLMPLIFVLIGQDMGMRCFSAKSQGTVRVAAMMAAILLMMCALCIVMIGLQMVGFGEEITLIERVGLITNPIYASLFAVVVLMAIVSTADALLCSVSSNICMDFPLLSLLFRGDERKLSQRMTFIVGIAAMLFSSPKLEVIPVMVFAYEISICAMAVPILMGVMGFSASQPAARLSFWLGAGSYLFLSTISSFGLNPGFAALTVSLMAFLITQLSEKKQS